MAFVPIPNSVKCTLEMLLSTQQVVMCFGWTKETTVQGSDLSACAAAMRDWFETYLAPLLADSIELVNVNATDLSSESGISYDLPISPPIPGEIEGGCTPNNVAMCVTERTTLRGRSYRGRKYIAGLPQASIQLTTTWDTTVLANMLLAWYELFDVETSIGMWRSIHSRQHNGVKLTTGTSERIWTYTIDSFIDSQRRRLAGRGT